MVKKQLPNEFAKHGKVTGRARLLADMKPIMPCSEFVPLVDWSFLYCVRCESRFCNCGATSPAPRRWTRFELLVGRVSCPPEIIINITLNVR
jgi:hypothetical protein